MARASAIDKNQCVFKHSSRSRPLNDSTKALSVGLPGRLKSSVDGVLVSPAVERLRDELRAVVDTDGLGSTTPYRDPPHGVDDLLALDALIDLDRQGLAGVGIDDGQRTQASPVEQRVGYEVHRPQLVRCVGLWLPLPTSGADVPPRALQAKAQPILAV